MRNRAANVTSWEFRELLVILLRQFKRLLADQGVELTDAQIQELAQNAAQRQSLSELAHAVREGMIQIVEASLSILGGWNLTYAQSLKTTMNDLPGWETTADFLELANEKGNAELRISAGASLLAGLGDPRYAPLLLQTYQHGADDPEDVDAVIARRALSFAAGIAESTPDWLAQIRQWLTTTQS
jgi:hypothetical protein